MSDSHLPDDFARWPKDPYQLLNVAGNADRRTVRMAYTRLIRQFKPEKFPEQFQTLREAYDIVLKHVEWREKFNPFSAEEQAGEQAGNGSSHALPASLRPEIVNEADGEGEQQSPSSAAPLSSRPLHPLVVPLAEELDQLWQRSCDGDDEAVYFRLIELERQYPGNADICVRLYWLLIVAPELQTGRSACDWLAAGLAAARLRGPLVELYRRELAREPSEAASGRCAQLMQSTDDPAALAKLAEMRWLAAGQMQRWDLIPGDLVRLRPLVAGESDELWGRMLLAACDQLAWSSDATYRRVFKELVGELEGLHLVVGSLGPHLDQLDFLLAVSEAWTKFPQDMPTARAFRDVFPIIWCGTSSQQQRALTALAESMLADPAYALRILDTAWNASRPLLSKFHEALPALRGDPYGSEPHDPRGVEMIRTLAGNFIHQHRTMIYASLRRLLLDFCQRESLLVEQIVKAIENQPELTTLGTIDLAVKLMDDVPLRVFCKLYREYTG